MDVSDDWHKSFNASKFSIQLKVAQGSADTDAARDLMHHISRTGQPVSSMHDLKWKACSRTDQAQDTNQRMKQHANTGMVPEEK